MTPEHAAAQPNGGSLTVIGTGIRTVGQLTTEAIAWMRNADRLLHVVADPIAEDAMRRLNPNSESLSGYYGEGKPRSQTYEEMVQHIVSCVRAGNRTCAAFYGHPGVFAYPSHESIRRVRVEGYPAQMLPAVSAEDCLFADLGVDPAVGGCQSYEATDFVMHRRLVDASSQLLLWQVGSLGDWTYRRNGYNLQAFPLLVQRLLELYPPAHNVVVYEAAVFPTCPPTIKTIPLANLSERDVTAASTLYVPPARAPTPDPYVQQALAGAAGAG